MPTKRSEASTKRRPKIGQRREITAAALDKLIEETTVDCYNESEQITGFYTMLEENLGLPFETWKAPLPEFIEHLYFKRFGKERPDVVVSIEDRFRKEEEKRAAKQETKLLRRKAETGS